MRASVALGIEPIVTLIQVALLALALMAIPILATRVLLGRRVRIPLSFGTIGSLLSAPIRGVLRLLTLTYTREHNLATQQVVLPNFPMTPLEFLGFVGGAIEQRRIPGASASLIARREFALFSQRRWYLHLNYQTSLCIIGAMPLGTAFVISWRLGEIASWAQLLLREHPGLHSLIDWFLRPPTFYRIDVNTAFQELARQAVVDAVDQITQVRGLRDLNEAERRQIMQVRA